MIINSQLEWYNQYKKAKKKNTQNLHYTIWGNFLLVNLQR